MPSKDNKNLFLKLMWPRKLRLQIALYVSLLLVLSMSGFLWHTANEHIKSITDNMRLQAKALANNISAVSAVHLLSHDYSSIEQLLERAIEFPGIHKIQLSNVDGKLLGDITRTDDGSVDIKYAQPNLTLPEIIGGSITFDNELMIVWQPIILGELIGWVKITYTLKTIVERQSSIVKGFVIEGSIIIILAVLLLLFYLRKSIRTIERYTNFSDGLTVVKGKQVAVDASSVELEHLGVALNTASNSLYENKLRITSTMTEMERLVAFPEMSPNIVLSMNLQGEVQYLNPYGEELIDKLDILQSHMSVLLPEDIKKNYSGMYK